MVVILFYQSFVVINLVTLFYENIILYSHIVKLNYYQTCTCPSAIKFDIINAFFVIKSDIFPFRNAVRYITIFHLGKEKDA